MIKQNILNDNSTIPILVVHDNPQMSSAITHNISEHLNVTEATSLAQAIKILSPRSCFKLVLVSMQIARFQSESTSCIGCKFRDDSRIIFLNDVFDTLGYKHIHRAHCTIGSPDPDGWNSIFEIVFNGITPSVLRQKNTGTSISSNRPRQPIRQPLNRHYSRAAECSQNLTPRQLQVLKLIRCGYSNRDIARQLNLSEGTVKLHNTGIFKSLGVRNRTEAALEAAKWL